jgi:glycosyltransferase involved in cell wall biosynthesis
VTAATVVVPTRDRPARLPGCLAALAAQVNRDELEILVVDDGSRDEGRVAEVVAAHPGVQLLRRPGVGIGSARNAGARAANAPFVLFTDDDCRPDPRWALLLVGALAEGGVAAGGTTRAADPGNPYARVSEAVCAFARDRLGFLVGNNFGCARDLLLEVPFDDSSLAPAGEDREWSARIVAAGAGLRHEPDALVLHDRQLDLRGFWAQHVRYGRGAAWFARHVKTDRDWTFYPALVAAGFRRGPRDGLLVCLAQLATVVGYLDDGRRR